MPQCTVTPSNLAIARPPGVPVGLAGLEPPAPPSQRLFFFFLISLANKCRLGESLGLWGAVHGSRPGGYTYILQVHVHHGPEKFIHLAEKPSVLQCRTLARYWQIPPPGPDPPGAELQCGSKFNACGSAAFFFAGPAHPSSKWAPDYQSSGSKLFAPALISEGR